MPQSNNKTLVRVLLWWTALLSICQVTLLVLFFTMGHYGQPQTSNAQESPMHSGQRLSPNNDISQDKAKMCTYEARGVTNHTVKWITLENCNRSGDKCTEEVNLLKDNETILTGWIDNNTLSTGLLCKAEQLAIGNSLRVQIKTTAKVVLKKGQGQQQRYCSLDLIYIPN
ncbi:hypothetical protein WMY93_002512 [Mugilogobius chulae]|uniref:Uncharacterized protein n=1 Tax=Mugilogobius chulae TaxID=88201 RepID=A0AAW0Q913_9GOBI